MKIKQFRNFTVVSLALGLLLGQPGCFFDGGGDNTLDFEIGGDNDSTVAPTDKPAPRDLCEGLALSKSSADPFAPVTIEHSNDDLQPLFIEAQLPRTDHSLPLLLVSEDNTSRFDAPMHPEMFEGGELALTLHHAEGSCPQTLTLQINPIERAPGTSQKVLPLLAKIVDAQAAQFGSSRATLSTVADPKTLPANLWPLMLADQRLQPSNPNNLQAVLDGQAPDIPHDPAAIEQLDAILAAAQIPQKLQQTLAAIEAVERPSDQSWSPADLDAGLQLRGATMLVPPFYDVDTVEGLSTAMRHANALEQAFVNNETMNNLGMIVGLAGLVPDPTGVTQLTSAICGMILSIVSASAEAASHILPRKLIDPGLKTFNPSTFEEDSTAKGSWSEFTVYAQSRKWNATKTLGKLVIDAIMTAKSNKGTELKIAKNDKDWNDLDKILDKAERNLETAKYVRNGTADNVKDFVTANSAKKLTDFAPDLDALQFPAYTWGPFDISDAEWSKVLLDDATPVRTLSNNHRGFEPRHTGKGVMRIVSRLSAFPPSYAEVKKEVEVKEILVDVEPSIVAVSPGQKLQLNARVKYALDGRVEWRVLSGPASLTTDKHTAHLTIRDSANDGDKIIVRARSTAHEGLRAPNRRKGLREGFSVLRVKAGVEILPAAACLKPGSSLQMEADYYRLQRDDSLRWTASAGRISQNGAFTAPSKAGEVTIRAAARSNPAVYDEVTVEIGDCRCFYLAQTSGAHSAYFGGKSLPNATYANDNLSVVVGHAFNQDSKVSVAVTVPEWSGQLGSFPAMLKIGTEGQGRTDFDHIMALEAQVTITSFDGKHIEGYVTARAAYTLDLIGPREEAPPVINVQFTFKTFVNNANDLSNPTDVLGGFLNHCLD